MKKYLLLLLVLTGCTEVKEQCEDHVYAVTATGTCMFDKYGDGSCAVLLDNEYKTEFQHPGVVGQKVIRCDRNGWKFFKTVNGAK